MTPQLPTVEDSPCPSCEDGCGTSVSVKVTFANEDEDLPMFLLLMENAGDGHLLECFTIERLEEGGDA